jgi:hypothetical protein
VQAHPVGPLFGFLTSLLTIVLILGAAWLFTFLIRLRRGKGWVDPAERGVAALERQADALVRIADALEDANRNRS